MERAEGEWELKEREERQGKVKPGDAGGSRKEE